MTLSRRQILKVSAGAAFLTSVPSTGRAGVVHVETGAAFGSAWRLVLPETSDALQARRSIEEIVARVDALMSPFRPDSEVSTFNDGPEKPIRLSAETVDVVATSLELARASDGAFDPTVAPLGRRFGFGTTRIDLDRPAGHFHELQLKGDTLWSERQGLSLDLCGSAKGYALDQIVEVLDGLDFVVELGGEIAARGRHPSGRPWQLGIERPGSNFAQCVINSDHRALATSAGSVQSYTVGGRQYSHVMDPRKAEPVNNEVASVSVLATSGQLADGLATASMVLGPGDARSLLAKYDASALFQLRRPQGLEDVMVGNFARSSS